MHLKLKDMTRIIFSEYLEKAIADYARENVESGRWAEESAIQRSREDLKHALPKGIETENNHLFEIFSVDEGCSVGVLWITIEEKFGIKTAFICDIEIKKEYRRKGYARSALLELERYSSGMNIDSIGLHVFRQNSPAQALYGSLGYSVVSTNMVKSIA
ncbi:GNAT family N-acetyltransferase [Motilimonas sp. E26]|uniref:GNAT family N-acetyltransferase n=1 Tax=Motilimonas sp. E26 TaxID=2865674 RepID=UPI001E5F3E70|nr:GNAT family N-acetyltransferase [Motilimonas sp. E26]MCE0557688.1 GNAT family N-acetyltransferase [Motilimonas sp. E26]